MPEQQRLRLGQDAELVRRHQALDGDRAQVDREMLVAALEGLGGGRVERGAEHRPPVDRAEEGLLVARLDALEIGERQQAGHSGAVPAQDRDLAGDGDGQGPASAR